jgi:deazaflavin-dependent oxidoreductase (nitroreductase family)
MDEMQELNRAVIAEIRATGKAGGPFAESDMLVLHSRGARTGTERVNPLAYLDHDGALLVVASLGGAPNNPAWYHNLMANPRTEIEVGRKTIPVVATEVPEDEYTAVISLVVARYPIMAEYQTMTTRRLPIIRLTPAGS